MSAEQTAEQVLAKVGLWWPDADENGLYRAASAWRALADAIDAATLDARRAVEDVDDASSGDAADAFGAFWEKYDGSCSGYLPSSADGCRALASSCEQYADAVADAKKRLKELAAEIGATVVVGTALAVFTFGASEAAAGGISAGLIAAGEAVGLTVSTTVADIVGTTLAGAAFGGVEAAAVDVAVAQPIRVRGFHDGGFSGSEVVGWALGGSAGGGLFAGTGVVTGRWMSRVKT